MGAQDQLQTHQDSIDDIGLDQDRVADARLRSVGLGPGLSALGALGAASTLLTACGGGGGSGGGSLGGSSGSGGGTTPQPVISDADAARFLLQAQFSVSDSDLSAVKSQGYVNWLNAQYAVARGQTAVAWLNSRGYNAIDANQYFNNATIGDNMAWQQLMTASEQVRTRLTLALSEMFVVSLDSLAANAWPAYLAANYWDLLANNVFGNFRTLLEAVTLNLAMGYYLNTKGNLKENSSGRQPDENYAREVMQLFTIGLYELNDDGTIRTDTSGNKIETYTQSDITNLARVFTGWDTDLAGLTQTSVVVGTRTLKAYDPVYTGRPMINTAANHSTLAATFLGVTVPANTSAVDALKIALDTLFNHHNVAPFFARQMIQRLVTSNPSPAYVARVASVFKDNGQGTRGDLKAVWTAIFTDNEARTVPSSATAGKLREPIVRLAQMARTFGAASGTGVWAVNNFSDGATGLSQSPLRSPSVFNFFRPGFVPPNSGVGSAGLTAPEFQIVNEVTVAAYINLIATVLANGINDVKLDLSPLLPQALNSQGLLDWLNLRLTANQLSSATLTTIKTALDALAVTASSTSAQQTALVQTAIWLAMSSTDYLVQR